ncbi:MAG TPA: nicotinate-nucleotide adenylyltransferase [Gemmataceae bacterium]|jgi:nicotinate-nucleotide adenylyltransferase|nr:nicotinate-nucleotide adenylyltransferase [Gemmataceae bacterium]
MQTQVGILGGTFDPIHMGHLMLAEQCREQIPLDQVWFMVSAAPPHKREREITPFDKRVDMVQLAIAGNPAFQVNEMEKERPGPSFTADTLSKLRRQHPQTEFLWILGSDTLPDLPHWHEPLNVVSLAKLIVVARPDWPVWPVEQLRAELNLKPDSPLHLQVVSMPLVDIASRDLRRRVAEGRSIRYLVPPAVAAYIQDKKLYR